MAKLTNRQMLEAIYKKVMKVVSNPFASSGNVQTEPVAKPRLTPQINLYPQEGVIYKKVPRPIPDGYEVEYDYANQEEVLHKTCGPIGTK